METWLWQTDKNELNTYLTCQPNNINPSVTCSLARITWSDSLVSGKQRSTDALCKWRFSITNFPFPLPVFVLLRLFLVKMTQCINKNIQYINTPNIYRGWRGKKNRWRWIKREKKIPNGCQRNQPKYSLRRRWRPAKTNTGLAELLQCKDENGWQFLLKDYDSKEYVSCASKKSGGLRFHIVWTHRRKFPQSPGDV